MKKVLCILSLALTTSFAFAQDETSETTPLEISGSGDIYYKYDFAKVPNIPTSFATDQNSVSLGMLDIALKKKLKIFLLLAKFLLDQEVNISQYQMVMELMQIHFTSKIYMQAMQFLINLA